MMYDLPTSVEVYGTSYEIRSDYRAILDICAAISDAELNDQDKATVVLEIFYPGLEEMPSEHYQEAIRQCFWFISCGDEEKGRKNPKLMDWEKDFKYIVAPINRVCGQEIRAVPYMHWWTFISAYYEIGGDCTFSQIVRVREKLAKGKKLDKSDAEWYRQHRDIVDLQPVYTVQDNAELSKWLGK